MNVAALEQMTTVSDTRDGPGQRLRRIRQSKNLELSKVAAELHLRVPILQSLEADAFDRLPEPVFVRGYLRSYAIFAQADEELAKDVGRIDVPTLIVAAEEDSGSTPQMAHALRAGIRDSRVVVVPGVRHLLPIEAPDRLARLLDDFFLEGTG